MKTILPLALMLIAAAPAHAAVTVLSAAQSLGASSPGYTCSPLFPGGIGYTVNGDTRSASGNSTSIYQNSVTSNYTGYGYGESGMNVLLGSTGLEITSLYAGVSDTPGPCASTANTGGRSSSVSLNATFRLDTAMNYTFTAQLPYSFASGYSGQRSYSIDFSGQGFRGSFLNSNPDGFIWPDEPRSINVSGTLPPGTYSFGAWINMITEAPPSYSAQARYSMTASLRFTVPEPGAPLLLLTAASSLLRRRHYQRQARV